MADDVDIRIRLRDARSAAADARRVSGGLDDIGHSAHRSARLASGLGGALAGLGRGAAIGGAVLAGGLLLEAKRATEAWEDSRKVIGQTEAVVKSTGRAAGFSAGQIGDMAGALSESTTFDDEAIQSGYNMLLTFKDVRGEVLKQAGATALDMSVAMGGGAEGMKTSAIQLGKALNDPIKGVSALAKVGVTFTDQQKDQIATMVKAGNVAGAQKIVLKELQSEFGGSAKAQATPLQGLQLAVGNLEETIGQGLSPIVDAAAKKLREFTNGVTPKVEALSEDIDRIFKRKDLSLAEKLTLTAQDARGVARPMVRQLGRELARAGLGEKVGEALERGAPAIANHAAAAAPKAAAAFGHAFVHSNFGGQLVIGALLAKKFGAFGRSGGAVAGAGFGNAFAIGALAYIDYKLLKQTSLGQYLKKGGLNELHDDIFGGGSEKLIHNKAEAVAKEARAESRLQTDIDVEFTKGAVKTADRRDRRRRTPQDDQAIRGAGDLIRGGFAARPRRAKLELEAKTPVVLMLDGKVAAEGTAHQRLLARERGGG